jgi:outer membrane protein TolC
MQRMPFAFALCAIILSAMALPLSAQAPVTGWDGLYAARLMGSSAYREARLALKSAELALDGYSRPWIPRMSLSTGGSSGLAIGETGIVSGSIVPAITLENMLGTTLSLRAPFQATGKGGLEQGNPSLNISRRLFVETPSDRLDAEAAVLSAKAAMRKAEISVRIALATEILNAVYYRGLRAVSEENLAVLERVRTATVDPLKKRELDRRILQVRKSILTSSNSLEGIDEFIRNNADSLRVEVMRFQELWLSSLENAVPSDSASIRALELSHTAAMQRAAFSLLPWLPNPVLGGSLSYDLDKSTVVWGLSLSFSVDLIDRGERELSTLRRKEAPEILSLKVADTRKSLVSGARNTLAAIEALRLDMAIQEYEVADAEDSLDIVQRLFDSGYASEEDLVIARIDHSAEVLAAQKIGHEILIQTLSLANYHDTGD